MYAVYWVISGDIVVAVVVARNLFRDFAARKAVDMAVADTVVVVQKVAIVEVTEKLDDGGCYLRNLLTQSSPGRFLIDKLWPNDPVYYNVCRYHP